MHADDDLSSVYSLVTDYIPYRDMGLRTTSRLPASVGPIETCALGVPPGRPTTSECTMSVQLSEAFLRASTTSYSSVSIMYTLVNGIPLAVEMSGNLEILS
jgi:hypothetical protein